MCSGDEGCVQVMKDVFGDEGCVPVMRDVFG